MPSLAGVNTSSAPVKTLINADNVEKSKSIAVRVALARKQQLDRYHQSLINYNAEMSAQQIRHFVNLNKKCKTLLEKFANFHHLSARALHRACKVARTIADLDQSDSITHEHLARALTFHKSVPH